MTKENEWNAESVAGIIEHMNDDHADAIELYLKAYGNVDANFTQGKMVGIDQEGIDLSYQLANVQKNCRVLFSAAGINSPLQHRSEARAALVAMVQAARQLAQSS